MNYCTTIDVLKVGNSVLRIEKEYFPDAIEYAQPEKATKDNGSRVVLCNWNDAMNTSQSFGEDQALIYSSYVDPQGIVITAPIWLKNHPFFMTAIDSKGLEFEDVVVAFDVGRKVWKTDSSSSACLRLLRKLYVAIAREKRSAVILI